MGAANTSVPEQSLHLTGQVHGGNNPVSGSTIGLYRAGATGYGSAATQILTQSVTTDGNGFFGLTGLYSCASSTDQMYLTATQGNPGLGTSANNPKLTMMVALGDCGNLGPSTYITVNEITTAAAAWALAQFTTDYAHIGASATNAIGLRNAFLNAQLLANSGTGAASTLPSTQVIETGKLLALADALAPCVNSLGSGPCDGLFSAATTPSGSVPTDTLNAAVNIVKYPANNVQAVFNSISSQPPFPTTLTSAPNDWTMSMTVSGGGLAAPTQLQLDQLGNVWVAGYYGVLAAYTPQGVAFSGAGFGTGGYLNEVYGLAVDQIGNLWLTDEEIPSHSPTKGCLQVFQGAVTPSSTALGGYLQTVYDGTVNYPESVASDPTVGYIDVGNYASGSATIFTTAGTDVAYNLGKTTAAFPVGIIPDAAHGVWMANQESATIAHDTFAGTAPTAVSCCDEPNAVAMDSLGNVWTSNYGSGSVSRVSPAGVVLINQAAVAGIVSPSSVVVDGAQNVWTSNYHGGSISEIAGGFGTAAAGTAISPSAGAPNDPNALPGGYGLDANLLEPFSLVPDRSGNLWVANHANDDVVMFFGLAAPSVTPATNVPAMP